MKHLRLIITLALCAPGLLWAQNNQQVMPSSLDLQTAIQFALQNNYAIRQAQERIEAQSGLIIEARSVKLPQITANYRFTRIDRGRIENFGGTSFGSNQDWLVNLEVSQRLYAGKRGSNILASEQHNREAALFELKTVINEQLFLVRKSFYAILLSKERIAVQEQALTLLEEQLENVKDRANAGAVSKFERLQAEVSLANGRPPLIRAQNAYRIALEEFREVIGYTSYTEEEVDQAPEFIGTLEYTKTDFSLWQALQTARAQRNEILNLQELEKAQDRLIQAEKGSRKPKLNLIAGYQIQKSTFTDQLNKSVSGWSIGVAGTWDIFEGKAISARISQAKSRLRQAQLNTQEKQLQIDVEVRRAFSQWQEAVALVEASQFVVTQAEEALRLARSRFNAGAGTQLDVLQSNVELTEARTNQLEAFHDYNLAVSQLQKAMGIADDFLIQE